MKFLIESYGCQLNMAESAAIETMLLGRGLEKTEDPDEADAVIINTCSVRKTAENRIWGRLGFYSAEKKKHPLTLIVTGCMAELMKNELKAEAPYIDAVIGTNEKAEIPGFILGEPLEKLDGYRFLSSYYREGEFSSYVPIMNGCNNFCSYCIVPYVRGREVSRPVEDIIREICFLDSRGVREITLLGQNVNSYSSAYEGRHVDFPDLLEIITPYMDNIIFVRFESPHPKDFSDHLISVIASEPRVAKHIHLPMQAGSTRILELMNRKTTREAFLALVQKMKDRIPGLTLSTDVMTGFPTETEEEYLETLSAMEEMGCTEALPYISQVKVYGVLDNMTVVPNGKYFNQHNVVNCTEVACSPESEDLALFKILSDQIPLNATPVPLDRIKPIDARKGAHILTIGFPMGLDLLDNLEKTEVQAHATSGSISRNDNRILFGFDAATRPGASGSPIFDEYGNLMGILNSGYMSTQGFNFGVRSAYLVSLLEKAGVTK